MPALSEIIVTVPSQASLKEEDSSCNLRTNFDTSQLCATNGSQEISFKLPSGTDIFAGGQSSLKFDGVFQAPLSSAPTDPFKIQIRDPSGTLIATDADNLIMADLDPAKIQSATI